MLMKGIRAWLRTINFCLLAAILCCLFLKVREMTGEFSPVFSQQEKKQIALTFDDGPDAECTEALLNGLKEREVPVTFFVLGSQAEEHPDLIARMQEEGHLIGCHAYEHVDLCKLSEADAREQIEKTNEIIYNITGKNTIYMRSPYGNRREGLEEALGMIEVLWNIDTLDWSCQNCEQIVKSVTEQVEEGDIILMHDEYMTTVDAALQVIDELQKRGYEFVTVDQLIFE